MARRKSPPVANAVTFHGCRIGWILGISSLVAGSGSSFALSSLTIISVLEVKIKWTGHTTDVVRAGNCSHRLMTNPRALWELPLNDLAYCSRVIYIFSHMKMD